MAATEGASSPQPLVARARCELMMPRYRERPRAHPSLPRQLAWGWVSNRYDNVVKPRSGDLLALMADLERSQRTTTEKNGPGLIASTFRAAIHPDRPEQRHQGSRRQRWRKKALVESVHLLMLDVDGAGCWRDDVLAAWPGCAVIHWSTYSHGVPGKGLRMRLVLPLRRAVSVEEHRVLYQWALDRMAMFGVDAMDTGCRDATRLMYMPGGVDPRAEATPWLELRRGTYLDPDALLPDLGAQADGEALEDAAPTRTGVKDLLYDEQQALIRREKELEQQRQASRRRLRALRRQGKAHLLVDAAEQGARKYLDLLCEALSQVAYHRHDTARRIIFAAIAACGMTLGVDLVVSELRNAAAPVFAARRYGLRELERLLHGAVQRAPRREWVVRGPDARHQRPVHDRARGGHGARGPVHDDAPGEHGRTRADIVANRDVQGDEPAEHGEGERLAAANASSDPAVQEVEDVHRAAEQLQDLMPRLLRRLRAAVIVDAGVGKSYAAAVAAVLLAAQGQKIVIAVPTNRFKHETVGLYRRLADMMGHPGLEIRPVITRDRTNCTRYDELQRVAPLAPDATHRFCGACPFNRRNDRRTSCQYQRQQADQRRGGPGEGGRSAQPDIQILTHAMLVGGEAPKGTVLIVDESPLNAMVHHAEWRAGQLADLLRRRDVEVNDAGAMVRLMRAIDDAKHDTLEAAEQLRAICRPDAIRIDPDYEQAHEAVYRAAAHGDHERLGEQAHWRDLSALRRSMEQGWADSFVDRQALHCVEATPLPLEAFDHVLYLDATATASTAAALLGPEAEVHQLRIPQPAEVKVAYIPIDLGTNSGVDGWREPEVKRTADIWRMLHGLTDSERTLHITLKKRRARGWSEGVVREWRGQVIHFGGEEGAGSNDFEDCDTVVADTWHVPRRATWALGRGLATLARARGHDAHDLEAWIEEARWQRTGAVVTQNIERIRTRRAGPQRPVRVFITGAPGPLEGEEIYGLRITHMVDPDELAFLAGHVTRRERRPAIRTLTAAFGGVWSPMLGDWHCRETDPALACKWLDLNELLCNGRLEEAVAAVLEGLASTRVKKRVMNWTSGPTQELWEDIGRHAGVMVTPMMTDQGRRPTPIFHHRLIDAEAMRRMLSWDERGVRWFRLPNGPRIHVDGTPPLSVAVMELETVDQPMLAMLEQLGERLSYSPSALYRWLRELAYKDEAPREVVRRLWRRAHGDFKAARTADEELEARLQAWLQGVLDGSDDSETLTRDDYLKALRISGLPTDTPLDTISFDVGVTLGRPCTEPAAWFERERRPDESDEALVRRLLAEADARWGPPAPLLE